jgi:hypothetical protein
MTTTHRIIEILMAGSLVVGCAASGDSVDEPIETAGDTAPAPTAGTECDDGCGEPPAPPPEDDDGCGGDCDGPIAIPDQRVDLSIEAVGTGAYVGLDLGCGLVGAGEFRARFRGTGELEEGRIHITAIDALSARIETDRGCPLDGVTIGALASVRVQATIDATAKNCAAFCPLDAIAEGLDQCGGEPEQAECRAECEASILAVCGAECVSETHRIAADAALSIDGLARLTECGLTAEGLLDIDVDLEFDRVIDGIGDTVCD